MSEQTLNRTGCPKCAAFDIETKELMGKLFGKEEQMSLTILIAQTIAALKERQRSQAPQNHLRFQTQANVDFMCGMISKFFVGLDEKDLVSVKKFIKNSPGNLEFNIQDEACPHKEQADASPTQP